MRWSVIYFADLTLAYGPKAPSMTDSAMSRPPPQKCGTEAVGNSKTDATHARRQSSSAIWCDGIIVSGLAWFRPLPANIVRHERQEDIRGDDASGETPSACYNNCSAMPLALPVKPHDVRAHVLGPKIFLEVLTPLL
jgi:hypothetical protein